jgi:hypothetical protein
VIALSDTTIGLLQQCRTCGEKKPIVAFTHATGRDGILRYRYECKVCTAAWKRNHLAKPEIRAKNRSYWNHYGKRLRATREGWARVCFKACKWRCRSRGIVFNITVADILTVFPEDCICPVLGQVFEFGKRSSMNPSLDRIRPELGYIVGNIAIISMRANLIKQDASAEELRLVASWTEKARALGESGATRAVTDPTSDGRLVVAGQVGRLNRVVLC